MLFRSLNSRVRVFLPTPKTNHQLFIFIMPSPISQQLSPPPILKEGSVEDTPSSNESLESAALRFQVELEFVQALANTDYLRCTFVESLIIL